MKRGFVYDIDISSFSQRLSVLGQVVDLVAGKIGRRS
jgi:hypothetical protein